MGNINWEEVKMMKAKNSALIQSFLKRRARRELLRSWGMREDKRRTASSIPLDSVKAVPGATYFKTEGKQLKVDLSRGVKWSNTKNAWCAKTMFAGKKYTLGYFRDEELANQAYLFAVDAKRRGTIKEHLIRIGAHPPPETGKRKRGRPRKYPRPEDLKKQKQLLPRYGSQAHKKLNSMPNDALLRMANITNQKARYVPPKRNHAGLHSILGTKPRAKSWPMPPSAMEEMNRAIQQAVQQQVAAQLQMLSPMLGAMSGAQPTPLSLNGSEVHMNPGQKPVVAESVFVKKEIDALPQLSPEPPSLATTRPPSVANTTPVLQPSSAPKDTSSILASSPTLNPTSFILPVNMDEESDSDDEMFDAPQAKSAPTAVSPLSG